MKKYFSFFILLCLIFANSVSALEINDTGFIPGQIWYSDSLIEGSTVKIYTAIWNNSSSSLSARVEFYDKNVILGTRDIVVPSLQIKDVSVSWKVTSGDHSISAKIISPSIISSGKKEVVILDSNTTKSFSEFVPVVINKVDGKPATSGDMVKSQIDKATSSLDGILPESISTPVSDNIGIVDNFRADTYKSISEIKIETQKKIEELNKTESIGAINNKTPTTNNKTNEKVVTSQDKVGVADATEKPIAYLKLFFISILSFIFASKFVFYSLIVVVLFFVFRFIYRKIRNR